MASTEVPKWLTEVLEEFSTDRFHVEFKGFIFNHLHQGVIALWRLGASEERVRRFAQLYAKDLEPARDQPTSGQPGNNLLSQPELTALQGHRQKFLPLVRHFRQRLADLGGDIDTLINAEFPALAPGLASKVFHGVIEVGYGKSIGDGRIVCEGLAYLHYGSVRSHLFIPQFLHCLGDGNRYLLDAFMDIRKSPRLMNYMTDKIHFGDDRDSNPYLVGMQTLLLRRPLDLIKAAAQIRLPYSLGYNELNMTDDGITKIMYDWVVDAPILIYAASANRNDSYFLHGVTGGWGLRQILPAVENSDDKLKTIVYFMAALLATYIIEGCPDLSLDNLSDVVTQDWDVLKQKALGTDCDEHVYKLIHVCHSRWLEGGDLEQIYLKAAHLAIDYPMTKVAK